MYRYINCVVVAGFVLSAVRLTAPTALAEEAKLSPQESPSEKKVTRFPFRGKIHAVDRKGMTITLEGKEKKRTLRLTAQTKIVKAGKQASLENAVIGEQVGGLVARYSDGREEVISIRLGPKPDTSIAVLEAKQAPADAEGEKKD